MENVGASVKRGMQADAHKTIINAMTRHADQAGVQEKGSRSFGNIAVNDNNKVLLTQADAHNTIINAMTRHADQTEVQEAGCEALRNLTPID